MDLGVYKSFTTEDEEEGLLDILKNLESRSDVKSVNCLLYTSPSPRDNR